MLKMVLQNMQMWSQSWSLTKSCHTASMNWDRASGLNCHRMLGVLHCKVLAPGPSTFVIQGKALYWISLCDINIHDPLKAGMNEFY